MNILILFFNNKDNLILISNIISSIKINNNYTNISLLTYKDIENYAEMIKNIKNIYYIDRKKIRSLRDGKFQLYGQAINIFNESIENLCKIKWDYLVNLDNNKFSSYMTLILKNNKTKIVGATYTNNNNIIYTNKWSSIKNNLIDDYPLPIISLNDIYHQICNETRTKESSLKTESFYEFSIINKLNIIRNKSKKKILAIHIDFNKNLYLGNDDITLLLEDIKTSTSYIPIIINYSSKNFEYIPVFDLYPQIKCDSKTLLSVINNVDLLICSNTLIKNIGCLLNIKTIEIAPSDYQYLKYGPINHKNNLLLINISEKYKKESIVKDIIYTILFLSGEVTIKDLKLSKYSYLYYPDNTPVGFIYSHINRYLNIEYEVLSLIARQYILYIVNKEIFPSIYKYILYQYNTNIINNIIKKEKEYIINIIGNILSIIKMVIQAKNNYNNRKNLINSLSEIISKNYSKHLVNIPIILFRKEFFQLQSDSYEETLNNLEKILYNLKDNIKSLLICIKELNNYLNIKSDNISNYIYKRG